MPKQSNPKGMANWSCVVSVKNESSGTRSGSVTDHFQLRGAVHFGEEVVDPRHRDVFQLGFPALTALKDGQRPYDHNRRVADLEGQVRHPFFHRAPADSALHFTALLRRPSSSHCPESGRYMVTTRILPPSMSGTPESDTPPLTASRRCEPTQSARCPPADGS